MTFSTRTHLKNPLTGQHYSVLCLNSQVFYRRDPFLRCVLAPFVSTTATLIAAWNAASPGDSPVDQYQITITGSDGGGTFTQTVSGTTLTASFTVDFIPDWSVTVRAHNAFGWVPLSAPVTLGGL